MIVFFEWNTRTAWIFLAVGSFSGGLNVLVETLERPR